MQLKIVLSKQLKAQEDGGVSLFAMLALGIVDSLEAGAITPSVAVKRFFHAANCQFVRKTMKNKTADTIMAHGVQLPDLLIALPEEESLREYRHELTQIRSLSLELLEARRLVA